MGSHVLRSLVILISIFSTSYGARLEVSGTDLTYNGEKVYLNGANIAWNNYGEDFGNGNYDGTLDEWLADIGSAGGNAIRIWVHVEGYSTPAFDSDGYVTGCDSTGDFVNDIKTFLDTAQANNILAILTLWNGAVMSNQQYVDLLFDDSKLDSYFDNCLNSFVSSVAGHPALGAWETVNEPEGSILVASDSNPCYDTTLIGQYGAGWTGVGVPMENFLNFIGRHNLAFKANDPTGVVTLGSWAQFPQSDAFSNTKNYYKDECFDSALGTSGGGIDFYHMHTYDWDGVWSDNAPFTVDASDYLLDKPIIIGEFASICAEDTPLEELHEYGYTHGYSGTLTWHWAATGGCSDTRDVQREGLGHLDGRTDNGIVDITVE